MNQIVVDTDVSSYLFNRHSSAKGYADALRGSLGWLFGHRRHEDILC